MSRAPTSATCAPAAAASGRAGRGAHLERACVRPPRPRIGPDACVRAYRACCVCVSPGCYRLELLESPQQAGWVEYPARNNLEVQRALAAAQPAMQRAWETADCSSLSLKQQEVYQAARSWGLGCPDAMCGICRTYINSRAVQEAGGRAQGGGKFRLDPVKQQLALRSSAGCRLPGAGKEEGASGEGASKEGGDSSKPLTARGTPRRAASQRMDRLVEQQRAQAVAASVLQAPEDRAEKVGLIWRLQLAGTASSQVGSTAGRSAGCLHSAQSAHCVYAHMGTGERQATPARHPLLRPAAAPGRA